MIQIKTNKRDYITNLDVNIHIEGRDDIEKLERDLRQIDNINQHGIYSEIVGEFIRKLKEALDGKS